MHIFCDVSMCALYDNSSLVEPKTEYLVSNSAGHDWYKLFLGGVLAKY